ncbi:MAG: O-antigen ligase family protein [Planctomycetes bacterium]|nr:O-antigen ligase family protein [Planctomycetota bacterium]
MTEPTMQSPAPAMPTGKRLMRPRAVRAGRRPWWAPYVCVASVFWLMLWAGINTGPGVFHHSPVNAKDWIHFVRTAFPLLVLVVAPLIATRTRGRAGLPGPLKLCVVYGLVGLGASALSPQPVDAMYWGTCYLAVFAAAAAYLRGGDPLRRAVELNWLTWAATTGILVILCIVARDMLYDAAETSTSYGTMGSVGGMPTTRSSGMARFAAVPAVLAYVMLWRDARWWRRVFWGALFAGSCLLIYVMQSRGATFSLALALVAATYVLGVRARLVVIVALLMGVLAIAVEVVPQERVHGVVTHITRGESVDEMRGMTGRTRDWAASWPYIVASPVVGYGFQADRYLEVALGGHIHNTYIYVLLTAGFLGLAIFVAGLVWAWAAAYRALRRRLAPRLDQEAAFAQTIGILTFFTLRSIPEVSGGMFGVDLMVMVPAIAYLTLLDRWGGGTWNGMPASSRGGSQPLARRQPSHHPY